MSLIDEALKRAQSAGEGTASPAPERPWSPPPMPDPGLARGLRWRRTVGAVLVALAAAGTVFLYVRRSPSGAAASRASSAASAPSPIAARAAAVRAPAALPEVVVAPPPSRRSAASPVRPTERVAASTEASEPPAAPPPRSDRVVSGRTYPGSVILPDGLRIELGGIVWSETQPRALLNDRILGVGGYVEGFAVESIETDRVRLRRDELTIYLSIK